ncbi:MAG: transcription/translation regulatory transformer protein RfaH, partial [Flavobacteriia bacterium]
VVSFANKPSVINDEVIRQIKSSLAAAA